MSSSDINFYSQIHALHTTPIILFFLYHNDCSLENKQHENAEFATGILGNLTTIYRIRGDYELCEKVPSFLASIAL
jgi:hypothetical protein